jgi:Mrp family chromosome partitioning ATPase
MPQMTGEFPRAIPRAVWLTARARNTVHRPVFIGAVGFGTFVAALVALVIAPQQGRRTTTALPRAVAMRPDTMAFVAALAQARARLIAADSSLTAARSNASVPRAPTADTLNPRLRVRRDSLSTDVNDLDALLARVETAPVAGSYRALAEARQMASSARARLLLDSLTEVEREREAFGTTGGADPVYVALTSRAAEIGRAIQAVGQARRDSLRQEIATLNASATPTPAAPEPGVDTTAWIAERDSAQSRLREAIGAVTQVREKASEYDRAAARAAEAASFNAPPMALLGAAVVLGVVLGFGSAFYGEMRHPRVSDEHEVERVTGARVLATIRPRPRNPDRQRRSTDRDAPPYFDPGADGYQLTYLHVARAGASRLVLTIAGADMGVVGVIATNVAAIAADEARSVIIIDAETRTSPVAAALRIRAEPGFSDVVDHNVDWAELTTQAMVGRDRVIDVIPSGLTSETLDGARVTALFRREAARLARHYEAIIVVSSIEQAVAGIPGALPIPDTILCARVGHTRLADLQAALDGVRAAGGAPLGIVLWDALPPTLPTPERLATAPRPLRTAEMKAITSTR